MKQPHVLQRADTVVDDSDLYGTRLRSQNWYESVLTRRFFSLWRHSIDPLNRVRPQRAYTIDRSLDRTSYDEKEGVTYAKPIDVDLTPVASFMFDNEPTGFGYVKAIPEKVPKGNVRRDLLLSGMPRKEADRRLRNLPEIVWPLQPGAELNKKPELEMRKFAMVARKREDRIEREQRIAHERVLGEGNETKQFHYLFDGIGHNAKLYAAAKHSNNAIHALCNRHYKTTLYHPAECLSRLFDDVSQVMTNAILVDIYNSPFTDEFAAKMIVQDETFKSSKWSVERWRNTLRKAIIGNACKMHAGTSKIGSILREVNNKCNEALSKYKPRAICSAGDDGCCLHSIGGVGFVEPILTRVAQYESRSIKHTDTRGIGARIKTMIHDMGMDCYAGSCDFGSFDGAVRDYIDGRLIVPILEKVGATFLDGFYLSEAAQADLEKESLRARIEGNWRFTASKDVASRESGDRGTSLKNLLANKFLFLLAVSLEKLYRAGVVTIKHKRKTEWQLDYERDYMSRHCITDVHALLEQDIKPRWWNSWSWSIPSHPEWVDVEGEVVDLPSHKELSSEQRKVYSQVMEDCRHWCSAAMPRHKEVRKDFDIMGEGDDGLQLLSKKFKEAGGKRMGSRWVLFYKAMGFQMEPQCPLGEVEPEDLDRFAFVPALQRMEFISRIWVPILSADGKSIEHVWSYPKPSKALTKCLISFAVGEDRDEAGYTKFVSMMSNSIDCPFLYEFSKMCANWFEQQGGVFNSACLTNMQNKRLSTTSKSELEDKYVAFTQCNPEAVRQMMLSFYRETGISPCAQHRLVGVFRSVSSNPERVALPVLATFGVIERMDPVQTASRW